MQSLSIATTGMAAQQLNVEVISNNIANISTTGFRREGVIFSEYVKRLEDAPSLSMARASARLVDLSQGELSRTGGDFDFAIQGDGFFLIETPDGQHLSRAGHFTPNAEGELVNPDGYRLLDAGGAPIFVPPDVGSVSLANDGTLSAQGVPLAQVGLWQPVDPISLRHVQGTLFSADAAEPMEEPGLILQGYLESSNVNPMAEIARMIEVQRAYEMGQKLLDREDERIRNTVQTLGK